MIITDNGFQLCDLGRVDFPFTVLPPYTSNGRFAVDREFEYMELVSRRGLGELFGPPWGALWPPEGRFGPLGGCPRISSIFVKMRVSTFR